jgi:hypothetical protein
MAEIPLAAFADCVHCGQPPLRYQPENPYRRQLLWNLITTALLAAITVIASLSLIGFAPGAHAHGRPAQIRPSSQSRRQLRLNPKGKGRQEKWTSTGSFTR